MLPVFCPRDWKHIFIAPQPFSCAQRVHRCKILQDGAFAQMVDRFIQQRQQAFAAKAGFTASNTEDACIGRQHMLQAGIINPKPHTTPLCIKAPTFFLWPWLCPSGCRFLCLWLPLLWLMVDGAADPPCTLPPPPPPCTAEPSIRITGPASSKCAG